MLSASGIVEIANGFQSDQISAHSSWPGPNGTAGELVGDGYARQSLSLPLATAPDPTRISTTPISFAIPAGDLAFFVFWKNGQAKAVVPNGGVEREVLRILNNGAIFCRGAHGLALGDTVVCMGGWPAPFVVGTIYYVVSVTPEVVQLATAPGGAPLAPLTTNYNTSMLISKIKVERYGEPGTFILQGIKLRWRWFDTGSGVVLEPTGYRWISSRPIPPQEISLNGGDSPHSILQYLTGGTTTSLKIVSGESALNALGVTYDEAQGRIVPAATLTPGVVDVVFRASNDVIVDYEGAEFYARVFTDRQWMPRDDTGAQHSNTGYGLGAGFWNDGSTKNGVSGKWWTGGGARIGIAWDYRTDFETTPIGSLTFTSTQAVAVGSQWTIDVTQAVKDIITKAKRNHGFLCRANPGTTGIKRWHPREHADVNFRPKLAITGAVPTTLTCESDGNLTNTETVDGATRLQATYSINTTTGAESIQSFFLYFELATYAAANNITLASQITQATITLTIESTSAGNATYSLHHMRPGGVDYWTLPTPQAGIAWPGSPTVNPNVKVGLRDENIDDAVDENGERCVLWSDKFVQPPDLTRYRIFYAQRANQAVAASSTTFTPGDIIDGDDNQFPSICTMQAMYPGQKSLRWYWNAWNSPPGHMEGESALAAPGADGDQRVRVKSIGADGLFTLVETYSSGSGAFGNNPLMAGATAYPHGFCPVYITAGNKMPLPAPFVQQPQKPGPTGAPQVNQWGPPYYVMGVASPGNNTFYLTDTPFGNPIIPTQAVTPDTSTFTAQLDYITLNPGRRNPTTPAKLIINSIAKKQDGSYMWPASAKYDYNGTPSMPEFYFRAYFFMPTTFRLHTQGAKQMWGGVDAQYDHIRGMGMGNGGSEGEGIAGCTIRGHSEIQSPTPLGQETNSALITAYTYTMHAGEPLNGKTRINGAYDIFIDSNSTSNFGETFNFNTRAGLGLMEKGRWVCIEWHAKTNTLVPNTDPIFIGDNVTPNYNCIVNGVVQPCPTGYACYNPIHAIRDTSIDPATGQMRNPFGGPYPNTFRSPIDLPVAWARNLLPSTVVRALANGNTRTTTVTHSTVTMLTTTRVVETMPDGTVVSDTSSTTPLFRPFKYSYTDEKGILREYELFSPTQSASRQHAGSFFAIDQAAASLGGNIRGRGDIDYRRAVIERLPTKAKVTPGQGGDGLYEVWVNGRLVYRNPTVYFRHVDVLKDGITPYLLMGPMLYTQVGGVDRDFFECYTYMTHAVLSTRYIGPMKIN